MSKVPTYVQSQSGLYYEDPVVRRPNWFVCWDDDEPIEVVVAVDNQGISNPVESVLLYLREQGWPVRFLRPLTRSGSTCSRVFPRSCGEHRMRTAECFYITQERGPTDELLRGNMCIKLLPDSADFVLYPDKEITDG
ncbi:MAG: hypothetical protein GY809_31960 [Planctomycetes bacterium]|nr:hypothetical protein [Planctomycetota bacterium]